MIDIFLIISFFGIIILPTSWSQRAEEDPERERQGAGRDA